MNNYDGYTRDDGKKKVDGVRPAVRRKGKKIVVFEITDLHNTIVHRVYACVCILIILNKTSVHYENRRKSFAV